MAAIRWPWYVRHSQSAHMNVLRNALLMRADRVVGVTMDTVSAATIEKYWDL